MKKLARNALLWCGYGESPRMPVACIKAPKTGLLPTPLNAINVNALLTSTGFMLAQKELGYDPRIADTFCSFKELLFFFERVKEIS